ncbi:MFS-type transporter SLC18B1-like isoform X2 [Montipora capricornis]|uniref:MFS-type transporter SLC18B1-like isoform X2 n=1 Tax=Montipora capricornis TaxID=246305 RepID=UPI0035F1F72E
MPGVCFNLTGTLLPILADRVERFSSHGAFEKSIDESRGQGADEERGNRSWKCVRQRKAKVMGASGSMIGLIFGIYPLVVFLVAPVIGVLLPQVGPRFTLTAGLFLCSGSQILFGFVSMLPKGAIFVLFCFLLRIVMAFGGAAADTASFAIVAGEFGTNIGVVTGAMETFTGLGFMLGPPLGGVLYSAGGFKLPFIVMGGILLSIVPVVMIILPRDENVTREKKGSLLQMGKIPGIAVIGFSVLVSGIVLGFLDPTFAPYMKKFGLGPSKVGLIFPLCAFCYAISAPAVGWICDKTGKTRLVMLFGAFCVLVGILILAPAPFLTFLPQRLVFISFYSQHDLCVHKTLRGKYV